MNSEFSKWTRYSHDMQDCKQSISFQCANTAKIFTQQICFFFSTIFVWIVCKCDMKRKIKTKQIVMQWSADDCKQRYHNSMYRESIFEREKKTFQRKRKWQIVTVIQWFNKMLTHFTCPFTPIGIFNHWLLFVKSIETFALKLFSLHINRLIC